MCEQTRVVRKDLWPWRGFIVLSRRRLDSATSHLPARFVVSKPRSSHMSFYRTSTFVLFFFIYLRPRNTIICELDFLSFFRFATLFSLLIFLTKMILLINKGRQNAIRFFTCFQMCSMLVVNAHSSLAITCRAMRVLMLLLTTQLWSNNWIKTFFTSHTLPLRRF